MDAVHIGWEERDCVWPATERLGDEARLFGKNNETPTVVQAYAKFADAVYDDVFLDARLPFSFPSTGCFIWLWRRVDIRAC